MPIYEYTCGSCGHRLEKLQKLGDAPLADCPACREPALRKLVSAAAFRLKGSGWYETDFKDGKSQKNLASGDDGPKDKDAKEGKDAKGAKDAKTDKTGKSGDKAAKKPDKTASAESGDVAKPKQNTAAGANAARSAS